MKFVRKVRKEEKARKQRQPGAMIVFCNTIKTVAFVSEFLKRQVVHGVAMIHGRLAQRVREKTLADFRAGKLHMLIATDVAARGLDIKGMMYCVNYDFPSSLEQYIHRIGRTGRHGKAGHAYSFFTRNFVPVAEPLIKILSATSQYVDPNLANLAAEYRAKARVRLLEREMAALDAETAAEARAEVEAEVAAEAKGGVPPVPPAATAAATDGGAEEPPQKKRKSKKKKKKKADGRGSGGTKKIAVPGFGGAVSAEMAEYGYDDLFE